MLQGSAKSFEGVLTNFDLSLISRDLVDEVSKFVWFSLQLEVVESFDNIFLDLDTG